MEWTRTKGLREEAEIGGCCVGRRKMRLELKGTRHGNWYFLGKGCGKVRDSSMKMNYY